MSTSIEVSRDVRWGDLDALGHVNNTVFFRFFEEARIALLARIGLAAEPADGRAGPILATASCRFIRPLGCPDTVTCRAGVSRVGDTSFVVQYTLRSHAQGALVATGDSVVVHFDYAAGTKRPLTDALRAALAKIPAPVEAG